MPERSECICSTECSCWQTKVGIVLLDIAILLIWKWIQLNRDNLSCCIGETFGGILGAFLLIESILQTFWTIQIFKNSRSYIRVYDDHVEGVTRVPFSDVDGQNKDFYLRYNEILQVEILRDFIRVYTSSQNYEAMALENQNWVLAEVRKRISTKN